MADNVTITPGSGASVAADLIGSVYYQRSKLVWGVDGTAVDASATNPLPAVLGNDNQVGGFGDIVDVTLSLDTSAYASGDLLADSQVVTGALRITDGVGSLDSVAVVDKDKQEAALTLVFLSANVTMGTENAGPTMSAANALYILGMVEVAAADYLDVGSASVACIRNIGLVLKAASSSANVYVAAVNGSGTPTFSADGLTLRLGIVQA